MSTARTCNNPKDGWALYAHFLGNELLTIRMKVEQMEVKQIEREDEDEKERTEMFIERIRAGLVGFLYMTMRQMKVHGYGDEAAQMELIIGMVIDSDLNDFELHTVIQKKYEEFNPAAREFREQLAQLKAEHARQ